MSVERVTNSLDAELATAVPQAADDDSQDVSAWLVDAARPRLAARGLRDVIEQWESEHGAFTEKELAAARKRLRV